MKKLFLFPALYILFASCQKDPAKDCSFSEANLAGSYKIVSMKYKASAIALEVDYLTLLEACEKDDVLTINKDHTYTYTDAGIACSPNGSDNGTWAISGDTIIIDGDSATVQNFDCSGFALVVTDTDTPGDKITATYSKQ